MRAPSQGARSSRGWRCTSRGWTRPTAPTAYALCCCSHRRGPNAWRGRQLRGPADVFASMKGNQDELACAAGGTRGGIG